MAKQAFDLHRACRVKISRAYAILFFALLGLGLPASNAAASPFVITLLGSGGSGAHRDDGNTSVDGRAGSNAVSASDTDRLGLSVRGRRTTGTGPTFGVPGGAMSLIPAIKRALPAAAVFGPTAFIDLGNGDYLAVSTDVAESIGRGVPAESSLSDANRGSGQTSSVPTSQAPTHTVVNDVTDSGNDGRSGTPLGSVDPAVTLPRDSDSAGTVPRGSDSAGTVPRGSDSAGTLPRGSDSAGTMPRDSNGSATNDKIDGVLADVSSGLVYSPPPVAISLAEAAAKGLAPADEAPAHAPEPATLILLASALAITAKRLRRRRI